MAEVDASDELDKVAKTLLAPRLTDEFLLTILHAARVCGWEIDHVVTMDFVRWCYDVAEKSTPTDDDLRPFGMNGV
jgi:hypothetical protein